VLGAALLAACVVAPAAAADKVAIAIIDGQNNHNWKATSPAIKDILEKTDRFTVEVLTAPPDKAPKEDWDKFKPDFSKYKAVLINYCGQPWPEDVQKAFTKFVEDGGGVNFYHFAVAGFPQWADYNKMMGMGWKDNKFGDRLAYDKDMKEVRTPKGEGPNNGHGPAHEFQVTVLDKDDPITKGMPPVMNHVKDELYGGQHGPAKDMHVLAVAWGAKDKGSFDMYEPMAWTIPFGKGRCYTLLLGHDVPAVSDPVSIAFLTRGTEWAATGAVTLPLPKDLPATEAKKEEKK
jgi:type 1 glutamine amidotransferase